MTVILGFAVAMVMHFPDGDAPMVSEAGEAGKPDALRLSATSVRLAGFALVAPLANANSASRPAMARLGDDLSDECPEGVQIAPESLQFAPQDVSVLLSHELKSPVVIRLLANRPGRNGPESRCRAV